MSKNYRDNQNKGKNNRNNQLPKLGNYNEIKQPLSIEYSDYAKLYLPDGLAYKYAKDFEKIENHQLRKVLDEVKSAVYLADADEEGFKNAQKKMFILVAMTAYNKGRMPKLTPLYDLVKCNINEKSITSPEDIKAFDQMFTSIVAYHKTIARN